MALSAFKSSSKRGNYNSSSKSISSSVRDHPSEDSGGKIPNRRARSVSAVSRSHANAPPVLNVPVSEFSNKRDNPLYSCSSSSSPDSEAPASGFKGVGDSSSDRRGRSVSRSSGVGNQSLGSRYESSQSMSRVDSGRRVRSVSRGRYGNSESEVEHGCGLASILRNKENGCSVPNGQRKAEATTSELDVTEETRNLRKWTSQHPVPESWDACSSSAQARNWEDRISSASFSEAEETLIGAVCEQMKPFQSARPLSDAGAGGIYETVRSEVRRAVSEIRHDLENAMQRKNPAIMTTENIIDIPPELEDPDSVEIVSEIRREYASKLEQSQERARKLRADLAVEEQREKELSRILKEMLSDQKSSDTHRSRPKKRTSIERLKMSRRLAEEAMNYFDECVSISTFDSSDFSSLEDPQPSTVVGTPPMSSSRLFPHEGSTFSVSDFPNRHVNLEVVDNQTQCSFSIAGSDLAISSSCSSGKTANIRHANGSHDDLAGSDTPRSGTSQFSFARESTETCGIHDISHYIKKFGKGSKKENTERVTLRSSYNFDDYSSSYSAESLLFDNVILRNRIESGGLLICNIRIF